jgi:hypothetical protein
MTWDPDSGVNVHFSNPADTMQQHDTVNHDNLSRHPAVTEAASQLNTPWNATPATSENSHLLQFVGLHTQKQHIQDRGGMQSISSHAPLPGANSSLLEPSGRSVPQQAFKKRRRDVLSSLPGATAQWWHVEDKLISQVSDEQLGEYLIGHSVKIPIPHDF